MRDVAVERRSVAPSRPRLVLPASLLRRRLSLAASIATAAETTLLDAAERGDRAAALRLLAKGANPNAPGPDGTTAIMWAAANDDSSWCAR